MTAYQATMIAGIMNFLADKITAVQFCEFKDKEADGLGNGSIDVTLKPDRTVRYEVGGKWAQGDRWVWVKGRDVWVHDCIDLSVRVVLDSYHVSEDAPDDLFSDRWTEEKLWSIPPTEDKRVFDLPLTLESLGTVFNEIDTYREHREMMRKYAEVVL